MKTNKIVTLLALLMLLFQGASAQGNKSLRISEVFVGDPANKEAWIEIQNTSWGTQNLGGFYITNNPKACNKALSAPERIKMMHLIPTGDPKTKITPQNSILLYADGQDNKGIQHMNFNLAAGDVVLLYSGNGIDLLDSVLIPEDLKPEQSFAYNFNTETWKVCERPTPTLDNNYVENKQNDKIAEFKEKDPYGVGMAVMAMGVVFACLALLYIFFRLFGKVARIVNEKAPELSASVKDAKGSDEAEVAALLAVTEATSGTGDENLDIALIALALEAELAHDEESGVITIRPVASPWAGKSDQIRAGMLY